MALENPSAQVRVTNRNNVWKVRDRYAGVEYVIAPGETVVMPAEAAEHLFGYGLDEKGREQKFRRMGIANLPKGRDMWERLVVKPVGGVVPTGVERQAA